MSENEAKLGEHHLERELGFNTIELKYKEEDQALIDLTENQLREYEKTLIEQINKIEKDPMRARTLFLNDGYRALLVNSISSMRKLMIPQYVIKT